MPGEYSYFSRLRIPQVRIEHTDGSWLDPAYSMIVDTGAAITVVPKKIVDGHQLKWFPIADPPVTIDLGGAFGKAHRRYDVGYLLFLLPEIPDLKFPTICAVADDATRMLLGMNFLQPNFAMHPLTAPFPGRVTPGSYRLDLKDSHLGMPIDELFVPPKLPD